MSAKIIDGRSLAASLEKEIAAEAVRLAEQGRKLHLAAVQVGRSPSSEMYTRMQKRHCEQAHIDYELVNLPEDASESDLRKQITCLNNDRSVSALILQMPLPEHLDARKIQMLIAPEKDAESVHPSNMGRLFFDDYAIAPCTPLAAIKLLQSACDDLGGKEVVIIGHSEIFGKPITAMLLASRNSSPTVTVCHIATKDLAAHTRQAEVLIVATGASQGRWINYQRTRQAGGNPPRPDLSPLIGADHLREGAIVIDVAVNRIPKGLDSAGEPLRDAEGKVETVTVGDVDFEAACQKVIAISPVPGGVGPVTVAMLLRNTIICSKMQQ